MSVQYIKIDSTSDITVATTAANEVIYLLGFYVVAGGTVSLTWKSGSTALTGALPLVANTGLSCTPCDAGYHVTSVGENLVLALSASVQVSGGAIIKRIKV